MGSTFDTPAFWQAVDRVRQERGMSWYGVFQRTGVIACRQERERQRPLSPANRQRLAEWARLDVARFEQTKPETHPVSNDERETHVSWMARQGLQGQGGVR